MKGRTKDLILLGIIFAIIISGLCVAYFTGTRNGRRIAVDFYIQDVPEINQEPRYKNIPYYSDYICSLCEELNVDPDLVVAILMVENPDYNPEAMHKNTDGTIDIGLFQMNDKYLWTTFKDRYWFDNIELNPFNWKHNTYLALHHIQYLQNKLKIEDDIIMAYNGGEGNVMNGTVKPATKIYLSKVKNNLYLLRAEK